MTLRFARRHSSWLIPIVVAVCAWAASIWVGAYLDVHRHGHGTRDVLVALTGLMALVSMVGGVVLAVRNGWRTRKSLKLQRRDELIRRQHEAVYADGWQQGRLLARELINGRRLEPLTVWGLVLRPSETAYLDVPVDVAELDDHSADEPDWRVGHAAQLIATNQRLVINTGRWLSVWYRNIVGYYPELDQWSVSMDIEGQAAIRLTGPLAPVIAVYLTALLYGRARLASHPEIAKLIRG
jgi:hypothetical protein